LKNNRSIRAVPTVNEVEASSLFTKEHVNLILALLKSNLASFSTLIMSVVQVGKEISVQSDFLNSFAPWIIDSGAYDYITNSTKLFESYFPYLGDKM
jgi:hypothetical protein